MSRILVAAAALGLSALPAAAGCVGQCYEQSYVPPSYETVTERVMTRAPRTYAVTTPAQYRTVQETVQVQAASRRWSVTRDHYGRQIGCWIETPARYETVSRTVMVQAPQVTPYAEAAQYGYRSHTVLSQPGYKTWTPVSTGYQGGYRSGPAYGSSFGVTSGYRTSGFRRHHHHGGTVRSYGAVSGAQVTGDEGDVF